MNIQLNQYTCTNSGKQWTVAHRVHTLIGSVPKWVPDFNVLISAYNNICDPLSENPAHRAFDENWDKTGNRYVNVQLCDGKKMEPIGSLVPELRTKIHRRCLTRLFEKLQCFTSLQCVSIFRILSCFVKLTCVLVKVSFSTLKLCKMSSDSLTGKTTWKTSKMIWRHWWWNLEHKACLQTENTGRKVRLKSIINQGQWTLSWY